MQIHSMRVVILSCCLSLASCGEQPATAGASPVNSPSPEVTAARAQGEALAKEVIAAFDQLVAEVAAALTSKPAEADAMPKLEAIAATWTPKMTEFAARRKLLTDAPAKGGFFACMGEQRGKAMLRKDNTLTECFKHYRLTISAPQVTEFLDKRLPALIEIAHNQ